MSRLTHYQPTDFFTGRQLKIAQAIRANDMAAVRRLAKGADIAAPADKRMTLLWFAIMPPDTNYDAIKTLVSLGVDPDTQYAPGIGSALEYVFIDRTDPDDHSAARLLRAMLDGGMSPNKTTVESHVTLLERAAGVGGSLELVKLLLQRGADINAKDDIGQAALYEAITSLNPDIAIYLVQHGANVNVPDIGGVNSSWSVHRRLEGLSPCATRTEFEKLRDLMIKKGAKWPPDSPEVVREQMRAKGLTPLVPPGHTR